jgi:hypothetical protein
MTEGLKIARGLTLPNSYITKATAVLAKRRIGKTYNSSVIAEEFVEQGLPFVVLDPTSAWWGLRASADGKSAGLPVTIIGGEHGDLPLDVGAGRALADLVIEEPGFYVLDLGHWESDSEHRRFAAPFLDRLYRAKAKNRSPLHLFVDEADVFAPQKPQKGDEKMLHNMQAIVRRGGIRGLGTTLITQRAAVLNKDVLTQLDLLIILRTISPQDQDAVDDYIKRGAAGQRAEIMSSLASLAPGEAWIYGPGEDPPIVQRVQFRKRRTFNSSATPEGQDVIEPRVLADVDLDRLRVRLADSIKKAEEDDPKALRKKIAELEEEIASARQISYDLGFQSGHANGKAEAGVETKTVDVPALENGEISRLEESLYELENTREQLALLVTEVAGTAGELGSTIVFAKELREKNLGAVTTSAAPSAPDLQRVVNRMQIREVPATPVVSGAEDGYAPAGLARDILEALASVWPRELSRSQLGAMTGKSAKAGYFANTLSKLRTAGYLVDLTPTQIAFDLVGHPEPKTPAQLRDMYRQKLGSGLPLEIFEVLEANPRGLTRQEIALAVGKSGKAGYFANMLSKVRGLGIVKTEGHVNRLIDELLD